MNDRERRVRRRESVGPNPRRVLVGSVFLFLALGQLAAQGADPHIDLHVNPRNGNDSNNGSSGSPFRTMNRALQFAYDTNQIGPPVLPIQRIFVHYVGENWPVAPVGFGGSEDDGWTMDGEPPRGPFPLRLVEDVDVIGVAGASSGLRPIIRIDEFSAPKAYGDVLDDQWNANEPKAYLQAATDCRVENLRLLGDLYTKGKADDRVVGIYARDATGLSIADCKIVDLYDGICLEAKVVGGAQNVVEASISDCEITDHFPVVPIGQEAGHAGLWLIGPGIHEVDVYDTLFAWNHDAIETEGKVNAPSGLHTDTCLSVLSSIFQDNENGLEVVGDGCLSFEVLSCQFSRNHNQESGTPKDITTSTAAIAMRGGAIVTGRVRDSTFENNAYSVFWAPDPGAVSCSVPPCWGGSPPTASVLDLGADASPGGNTLLPYSFLPPYDQEDPFRVHVFHAAKEPLPGELLAEDILAAENTWIPFNQNANAEGCYTGSIEAGPSGINVIDYGPQLKWPPGPDFGQGEERNYAIRYGAVTEGHAIDFGDQCPQNP